ncbi:MAG: DUF475 domain-containing protein [Gammaproteobacteria bacterium]|nr:DUF475 domain-containing protein [Gammaproteobacteria bacterium]MBU1655197.1 DUF475 domain-containing protein [Gammaproteobacteria bacterium]MBU1962796.1 DUF475 domain-containing protein [Gammaproteobacteria bacterium]
MKDFRLSFVVTFICLALAGYWGLRSGQGMTAAVVLALILGVMEVSLSFDNAVVNAAVLKDMDERWQQIFLTIGILIAVFGMRLFFPILIVTIATGMGMGDVAAMALDRPEEYARHLQESHVGIAAFGGMFLMLVFLSFLLDEGKELHWLGAMEERLSLLGKLDSIEVMVALLILFGLQYLLPLEPLDRLTMLVAGVGGVILYIAVSSLDSLFESEEEGEAVVRTAKRSGVAGFLYLEVLDASFSFDGVIGAFAITRDVVIIMLGLAIGAMFVRSLTVYLVRKGTLDEYVFLEHGAHYAIGALAGIMLAGIVYHVSEVVTGLIGVGFILLALVSSIRYRAKAVAAEE